MSTIQLFIYKDVPGLKLLNKCILNTVSVVKKASGVLLSRVFNNSMNRVGFLWSDNFPYFPFGNKNNVLTLNDQTFTFFNQDFYNFVKGFTNPTYIDLIACNLNSDIFNNEISILKTNLPNITFEYSVNKVGGGANGSWILSSDNVNIQNIYFNKYITNYKYDLDSSADGVLVIKEDGTVWATGNNYNENPSLNDNFYGTLGVPQEYNNYYNSSSIYYYTQAFPTQGYSTDLKAIATTVGYLMSAIVLDNGSVWTSGDNYYGELGTGDGNQYAVFQKAYPLRRDKPENDRKKAIDVKSGDVHLAVLLRDGTVIGTGDNEYGQMGNPITINQLTVFTQIYPQTGVSYGKVKQIACGEFFTMLLLDNGMILGTGDNSYGQLGIGNYTPSIYQFTPAITSFSSPIKKISCGEFHTVVLLENGQIWSTGYNHAGQLGIGSFNTVNQFIQATTSVQFVDVACGGLFTLAVTSTGQVYGTGLNGYGQLGSLGYMTNTFTQIVSFPGKKVVPYASYNTSYLLVNETVYAAGDNSFGNLGIGPTPDSSNTFIPTINEVVKLG
jgi:alpha-tubulin suppressor-like RCC1 family protein